ncbi:hypothetical protein RHSIM_Rhsim08G0142900 [Rhododendron simsii]|uniref:Uncharacterized protein n=1 Tax=Rhododendron simsii TaxID=118357 RepID=A0A834LGY3_RHOSS|nr:hypothetical protein RHSIM_Rhsim08G0142900 [Rhododendron simsii]
MEGSRSREISVEKSSNLVSCSYEEGTEVVSKHLLLAKDELAILRSSREPRPASGGKEKAVKKSRKCHGYGLTGQSHDKRNWPNLLNISSQDVRLNDDDDMSNDDDECKCL